MPTQIQCLVKTIILQWTPAHCGLQGNEKADYFIRGATALKSCHMAVQGALWLAKRLSLNLNFSFLNQISLLLIQVATQLSSQVWVDPIPDPILPEKFLGCSRESNPGPLGWQSNVLTTIPNRRSMRKLIYWLKRDLRSCRKKNRNYRMNPSSKL